MEEIDSAGAGEVVAMFGVDCKSMDTFSDGGMHLAMSSMFVPVRMKLSVADLLIVPLGSRAPHQ
jgi:translation elongation factor EF-G